MKFLIDITIFVFYAMSMWKGCLFIVISLLAQPILAYEYELPENPPVPYPDLPYPDLIEHMSPEDYLAECITDAVLDTFHSMRICMLHAQKEFHKVKTCHLHHSELIQAEIRRCKGIRETFLNQPLQPEG